MKSDLEYKIARVFIACMVFLAMLAIGISMYFLNKADKMRQDVNYTHIQINQNTLFRRYHNVVDYYHQSMILDYVYQEDTTKRNHPKLYADNNNQLLAVDSMGKSIFATNKDCLNFYLSSRIFSKAKEILTQNKDSLLSFYAKNGDSLFMVFARKILNNTHNNPCFENGYIFYAYYLDKEHVGQLSSKLGMNVVIYPYDYFYNSPLSNKNFICVEYLRDIDENPLFVMIYDYSSSEQAYIDKFIAWLCVLGVLFLIGGIVSIVLFRKMVIRPVNKIVGILQDDDASDDNEMASKEFQKIQKVVIDYKKQYKDLQEKNQELQANQITLNSQNQELQTYNAQITRVNEELELLRNTLEEKNKILFDQSIELKEKENYLQTVINALGEGLILCNLDQTISFANQSAALFFEMDIDDLVGKPISYFFNQEMSEFFETKLKACMQGTSDNYEISFVVDHKIKYAQISAAPKFSPNGKILASVMVIHDITNETNYDKQIHRQELELIELSNALEQNPVAVLIANVNLNITYVNSAFEDVVCLFKKDVYQKSFLEVFSNVFDDMDCNECISKIKSGNIFKSIITKKVQDNTFTFDCTASPIFNQENQLDSFMVSLNDITSKVKIESQLEYTSSLYNMIFANCNDIMWIYDAQAKKITHVSDSVRQLGYTPEELLSTDTNNFFIGSSLVDLFDRDRAINLDPSIDQLRNLKSSSFEMNLKHKDGTIIEYEMAISPLFSSKKDKAPSEIFGINRNISERKEMERRLIESESKYRLIAENTGDLIWKVSLEDYKITFVSKSVEAICGYKPESVVGLSFENYFGPEQFQDMVDRIKLHTKNGVDENAFHRFKSKIVCKDSTIKQFEFLARYVKNQFGKYELVGVSRDVTEQQQSEMRINEINTKLKAVLENIPLYIYLKDSSLKFNFVNRKFADIFGLSPDDFVGKTDEELNLPEAYIDLFRDDNKVLENHLMDLNNEKLIIANQRAIWYSLSRIPYHYTGTAKSDGVLVIIQDISERKHSEIELTERSRRFENTINNLSDIYLRLDFWGNIQETSPSFAKFVEIPDNQSVIGKNLDEFITSHALFETLNTRLNIKGISFDLCSKKDKSKHCEINFSVVNDSFGNPIGYEGIAHNISERIKYEEQLGRLTDELKSSLERTKVQKNTIESVYRGLTDSINYAKRIQDSLLDVSLDNLNKNFPQGFLIYKPCELVGGDFYYVNKTNRGLYFAVADCTGHGVPGAFMSVLAIGLLNEIIASYDGPDDMPPSQVLEELRVRIIASVSKSVVLRDGLDIALCYKDDSLSQVIYSGANIPLFIGRNKDITTYSAVSCPIGLYPVKKDFVDTVVEMQNGDMMYLCSDGYSDQLGAQENRRLSQRTLLQNLTLISSDTIEAQKLYLEESLNKWKGTRKQTDDITILGLKFL